MNPFLCPFPKCGRRYCSEDKLRAHQEVHSGHKYKCSHCDASFGRISSKYRHHRQKHINPTIKSSMGFFKFSCDEIVTNKRVKSVLVCDHEGCGWRGHTRRRLEIHQRRHRAPPPRPKVWRCGADGCPKQFNRRDRYEKHIDRCKYHICSLPRVVQILSTGRFIHLTSYARYLHTYYLWPYPNRYALQTNIPYGQSSAKLHVIMSSCHYSIDN